MQNHVVICNWNDLGDQIIRELHAEVLGDARPVVIVTDNPEEVPRPEARAANDPYRNVYVIPGDPTSDRVLARANTAEADTAIVLADPREGNHADTKSVLTALAIEAIEPSVHTIVELRSSRNQIHFEHTSVDEVVCVDELTEKLIAQSALTHGLSELYTQLLTATEDTNEVYVIDVPGSFVGRPYRELERALIDYDAEDVILVGLQTIEKLADAGEVIHDWRGKPLRGPVLCINPADPSRVPAGSRMKTRDHILRDRDRLFVIAYRPPKLIGLA